jgi:hypothetical protein
MLKTITSVANTVGSLEYKGLWNAATNTPTLVSSVGTQGDYYVVSVAGTTNLDGVTTWDEGDWAIFNGSVWQLFQDGQDGVFATLTVSNYAAFADNAKATFGTGAGDLQIYHNGSHSFISDVGTGRLYLQGTDGVRITNASAVNMISAVSGDGVYSYYNGGLKLSTTATGIDISGTATMDGLVVDGAKDSTNVTITAPLNTVGGGNLADYSQVLFDNSQVVGSSGQAYLRHYANSHSDQESALAFGVTTTTGTTHEALRIDGSGDISFFEDTGTNPKFVWDASAENLTLSGTGGLTVSKTTGPIIKLESTSTVAGAGTVIGDLQFYGNDASSPGAGIKASITATIVAAAGDDSQLMFSTSDGATNNVNRMLIANNGDVSFYENTGTTPKFVWDSSAEALGIGTASPQQVLQISQGASGGTTVLRIENTETGIDPAQVANAIEFYTNDNSTGGTGVTGKISHVAINAGTTYALVFSSYNGTTLSEAMRISSDGAVIVNNGGAADGIIKINGATGNTEAVIFQRGGTEASRIGHANSADLAFYTGSGATERARLTGDGSLLVGTTTVSLYNSNSEVGSRVGDGVLMVNRSGLTPAYFNRLSNDGDIIDFRQSGTTVGSIGSLTGNQLIIDSAGDRSGIRLEDNALLPRKNSAMADGTVSLGSATYRFKDLYLSGGVVFGTTGGSVSSKTLDDYEEGTWTPAYTADSGAATYNVQTGSYVKVGKLVTVIGELQASRNTLSGAVTITGLPFASSGNGGGFNPTFAIRFASDMPNLKGYTSASSIVLKKQATSSTNSVDVIETDLSNTATNYNYLYFTATYMTA